MKYLFLFLMCISPIALASDFSGFDSIMLWIVVSWMLAFENLVLIICFFSKVLFIPRVRFGFNVVTFILVFIDMSAVINIFSERGAGEIELLVGVLAGVSILPILAPNKFQKFERKRSEQVKY